ncbi:hypothetical protein QM012_009186 [Aureobasidium pullulans]|uniref:Cytochrome b561 domain-containing protein n=1 Tax=Aureobasidium pullulans TaxID=5580 RepID=A0ABR0THH8_AURPU
MSGSSKHSWIAVGTGTEMHDSMMFVLYSDKTNHGATLSTRYSTGEQEPRYLRDMRPETHASNENNTFSVDAHYKNSSVWMQHHIDMNSSKQPFIFALGPKLHGKTGGSPTATIQRHVVYGRFTMDMTQALSSSMPAVNSENGSWISSGASSAFDVSGDFDVGSAIHAVVMGLAFVIVFPLGALLLRFISVRVHYVIQLAASLLVIVGLGTGIYISMEYNKASLRLQSYGSSLILTTSKTQDYMTAHQIIGLIVFAAVIVQLLLGTVHHVIYKRTYKSTRLGRIHLYLGPGILVLGIINAPLGLILGQRSQYNVPYAILVTVLAILFFVARGYLWRSARQDQRVKEDQEELQVPLRTFGSTTKLT